jgi:hypothetical protein
MKITELVEYLETVTTLPVFPLAFPAAEGQYPEAMVVQFLTSYTKSKAGTQKVNIQMIVRSNHPEPAEEYALQLAKHFDMRTNFNVGKTHVIFCDLRTPFPLFVGRDNAEHYRYSVTMNFLVDKTEL